MFFIFSLEYYIGFKKNRHIISARSFPIRDPMTDIFFFFLLLKIDGRQEQSFVIDLYNT